jgi:hypothetical protein
MEDSIEVLLFFLYLAVDMRCFFHSFIILLLTIVSASASYGQNIEINVSIGDECAPYAIVKSNSSILGVADSLGRLFVPAFVIHRGDTISAGYSNFDSRTVIFKGSSSVSLKIKAVTLSKIYVKSDNKYRLKEYLSLFKKFKYYYQTDYYRYCSDYDLYYINSLYRDTISLKQRFSEIAFKPYHIGSFVVRKKVIGYYDKDYYLIVSPKDTSGLSKSISINTFNIAYASSILFRLTNRKMLLEALSSRDLLIHKITDAQGRVSYAFFEGVNRENQTVVLLDASGKKIERIERNFIGGGKGWMGDGRLQHTVIITLEYTGKSINIKDIRTKLFDGTYYTRFSVFTYNIKFRPASFSEQGKLSDRSYKDMFLDN